MSISKDPLDEIIKIQFEETIKMLEANHQNQPFKENDDDFGLVPEKPIYTLAFLSVAGEKEYLSNLRTTNGEKIKWNRWGSLSADGINGMIDVYETFLPSGEPYKTIYINMYGAEESKIAPAGFILANPKLKKKVNDTTCPKCNHTLPKDSEFCQYCGEKIEVTSTQKTSKEGSVSKKSYQTSTTTQNSLKVENKEIGIIKFCEHCGSTIDIVTKRCTSCDKKYHNGEKSKNLSIVIKILSLVIVVLIGFSFYQYKNIQKLQEDIKENQETIDFLEETKDDLVKENSKIESKLEFFDDYAVLINEDSELYHNYGCEDFDDSNFWIYNIDAAEDKGYHACPNCY